MQFLFSNENHYQMVFILRRESFSDNNYSQMIFILKRESFSFKNE